MDFGSACTKVVWANPVNGKAETVRFDGHAQLPTLVYEHHADPLAGWEAYTLLQEMQLMDAAVMADELDRLREGMSRCLDPDEEADKQWLRLFFGHVVDGIRSHCGNDREITEICISVPTGCTQAQVDLIRSILDGLGSGKWTVSVENGLTAAVRAYAARHGMKDGESVVVFSMGYTCTVAAQVLYKDGQFKLTGKPAVNDMCGGQDMDYLLYSDLCKQANKHYGTEVLDEQDCSLAAVAKCRRLKEMMSDGKPVHSVRVILQKDGEGTVYRYRLTQERLSELTGPKMMEALSVLKAVLPKAAAGEGNKVKVLPVGGATLLPTVRQLMEKHVENITVLPVDDPVTLIAEGLAVDCSPVMSDEGKDPGLFYGNGPNPAAEPLDEHRTMKCKNCGSLSCYGYTGRAKYHCCDCGWEGRNIGLIFK